MNEIIIKLIKGFPEINKHDSLADLISENLKKNNIDLQNGDILCIAHKIVSKAEGRIIHLPNIKPSSKAIYYANLLNKDPRKVEVILRESKKIIRYFKHQRQNEGTMICESKLGFISANAGVDESNVDGIDNVLLLPKNPDMSAKRLMNYFKKKYKKNIGIVITDTFGRPWRLGQVNVAVGVSGIPVTKNEKGNQDSFGNYMKVTEPAFCDEIAAASGLLIKKSGKTPIVLFRGIEWISTNSSIKDILRTKKEDMFL